MPGSVATPTPKEKTPMMNLGQMFKQAQECQGKIAEIQEKMAALEVTGVAGGGMVQVTLNGKGEARRLKIDSALVSADETAVLEDLILAAFNDAKGKIERMMRDKMSDLTGGLPLPPGMQLPF